MAIKLHRCPNLWAKMGSHPCWKVQKALDEQGIDYEIVKGPWPRRKTRTAVIEGTGQTSYPGDPVRERHVVSRAVEGHGADDPRREADGEAGRGCLTTRPFAGGSSRRRTSTGR